MTKTFLIAIFILNFSMVFSQAAACGNKLDTAAVIKIATCKNSYWTKNWQYPPSIKFDEQNCEWIVQSFKSRYTNKGKCKYTNGCTEIQSVSLVIDATNGKIKSRTKGKKLYYNYE